MMLRIWGRDEVLLEKCYIRKDTDARKKGEKENL
jgi:hypothetical protein